MHIIAPAQTHMGNKKKTYNIGHIKKKELKTNTKKIPHKKPPPTTSLPETGLRS